MEPDGYLMLTTYRDPWGDGTCEAVLDENEVTYAYRLKIPFVDLKWWKRTALGVVVCHTTGEDFMLIPWNNIVICEWKTNSDDYKREHPLDRTNPETEESIL